MFFCLVQLGGYLIQKSSHGFLAVKHVPGLLIALNIVLDFSLQILVDPLVLQDTQQAFVDLGVQSLVLIGQV